MAAAANPFDTSRAINACERMQKHLGFHRAGLCDSLALGAIQYASEIYPVGEGVASDCTRVAFAVFTFLVGTNPRQAATKPAARSQLLGMQCPVHTGNTPLVHYISLTGDDTDPFDTGSGHRFVILQSKARVRVLHAFQGLYTIAEYARQHPSTSMSSADFSAWWEALQMALKAPDMRTRAESFATLFGVAFDQAVARSWILSRNADLSC
jgi:hypothetical protein